MIMKTSSRGIQFIKEREAFRPVAYMPTPNDRWTVGYGFTEIYGRPVREGDTMTQAEADARFAEILAPYEACVNTATAGTPTTQNQFDAMVSFCFNVGTGKPDAKPKPIEGFLTSSVLRAHLRGDHTSAARAFGLWNKQAGKVLPGLVTRRNLESNLYLEPDAGQPAPMPQTVDPEPKFTASTINRGGIVATVTTVGATIKPILDTVNEVKAGTDSLGTWAVPLLLAVAVVAIGYMVYERIQLRHRGQA